MCALQASRERLGDTHLCILILMYCAAATHLLHDQFEEAVNLLGRLVEIVKQKYGNTWSTAMLLYAVGSIQVRKKDREEVILRLERISDQLGIAPWFIIHRTEKNMDFGTLYHRLEKWVSNSCYRGTSSQNKLWHRL